MITQVVYVHHLEEEVQLKYSCYRCIRGSRPCTHYEEFLHPETHASEHDDMKFYLIRGMGKNLNRCADFLLPQLCTRSSPADIDEARTPKCSITNNYAFQCHNCHSCSQLKSGKKQLFVKGYFEIQLCHTAILRHQRIDEALRTGVPIPLEEIARPQFRTLTLEGIDAIPYAGSKNNRIAYRQMHMAEHPECYGWAGTAMREWIADDKEESNARRITRLIKDKYGFDAEAELKGIEHGKTHDLYMKILKELETSVNATICPSMLSQSVAEPHPELQPKRKARICAPVDKQRACVSAVPYLIDPLSITVTRRDLDTIFNQNEQAREHTSSCMLEVLQEHPVLLDGRLAPQTLICLEERGVSMTAPCDNQPQGPVQEADRHSGHDLSESKKRPRSVSFQRDAISAHPSKRLPLSQGTKSLSEREPLAGQLTSEPQYQIQDRIFTYDQEQPTHLDDEKIVNSKACVPELGTSGSSPEHEFPWGNEPITPMYCDVPPEIFSDKLTRQLSNSDEFNLSDWFA